MAYSPFGNAYTVMARSSKPELTIRANRLLLPQYL